MQPSLLEFIRHIHDETRFCIEKTANLEFENFIKDDILCRAIVRSLEIIGEASKRIPPDFKSRYPLVEWKEMTGMRDRLIHHYFGVDYETVWRTVKEDIPALHDWIEIILKKESN